MVLSLFFGFIFAIFWMIGWYVVYVFSKNSSYIDVGWVLSIPLLLLLYFFLSPNINSIVITYLCLISFWSIRQSFSLLKRIWNLGKDPRYITLEKQWKAGIKWKYFILFIFEGFVTWLITIPFVFINSPTKINIYSVILLLCIFISIFGELIADFQKSTFINNSKNKQKVCNTGLWKFSRHPNYFFQFLIWVFTAGLSFSTPYSVISIISPLIMYIILTKISGIPPAERQSLKSRKEAYKIYQKNTPPFFPWKMKSSK